MTGRRIVGDGVADAWYQKPSLFVGDHEADLHPGTSSSICDMA